MGSALARRFLAQGVTVVVWNRTTWAVQQMATEGAIAASDLATIWTTVTTVCTFLADDAALENVLLGDHGLLVTAPRGATLIELSTVSPGVSAAVAEFARAREVRYVRAPVSGNPGVLAAGNLALIVSGKATDVDSVRPVLELIGPSVTYVGPGEAARVVKLAVNALVAGTAALLAEVVVLSEGWDIERSVLVTVLQRSAIGSPFIGYKAPALLARDYRATFTLAMALKDLRLAHDAAGAVSVPMLMTDLAAQEVREGCDEGLGDLDFMALVPHVQHAAGRAPDVPLVLGREPGTGIEHR
jgi:3-hydroxyisobutyrate dehydrogenase-like beta-hydroxyacid dehydrogenase